MKKHIIEASLVVHGIAERDGKFLLVQEKNGKWSLPTGTVEKGETIINAIKREVKEETGVECKPIALFKIIHDERPGDLFNTTKENILRMYYFFIVEVVGEVNKTENEHTLQSGWFTEKEIKNLKIRTKNLFNHIETFKEVKRTNSMMKINQVIV